MPWAGGERAEEISEENEKFKKKSRESSYKNCIIINNYIMTPRNDFILSIFKLANYASFLLDGHYMQRDISYRTARILRICGGKLSSCHIFPEINF